MQCLLDHHPRHLILPDHASARLAAFQGRPLSADYHAALGRMVDYLVATLRPDGLTPVVGDADDGRLHIFSDFGAWRRQDCRHVLGPSSALLGRPEVLDAAGPDASWEAAWWGFRGIAAGRAAPPDGHRLFPEIGIAVARREGHLVRVL